MLDRGSHSTRVVTTTRYTVNGKTIDPNSEEFKKFQTLIEQQSRPGGKSTIKGAKARATSRTRNSNYELTYSNSGRESASRYKSPRQIRQEKQLFTKI